MEPIKYLWSDRKRYLGLPISFVKYSLSDDRIFRESGILNLKEEEVLLYRVRDIELQRKLFQRIFRVGTICIHSSDKTSAHLDIVNVKNPKEVKELIYRTVEQAKEKRRMSTTEFLSDSTNALDDFDDSCEME